MAIKVLINQLGQHLVADVKQVSDTETNQLIAYWVKNALHVSYTRNEGEEGITINFVQPVPISADVEYAISAQHIVSILDPKPEVEKAYLDQVSPIPVPEAEVEVLEIEGNEETALLPKPERPEVN